MSTTIRRAILIAVVVIAVLAGALWFAFGRGGDSPEEESTGVAVMPSDGGGEQTSTEDPTPTDAADAPEVTGDLTDPEQVALAFVEAYPGKVENIADPTFLASLKGVDASLLDEVTDPTIEQVDHSVDETYERYAFTVSGSYDGQQVQAYTITVARPAEPAEGGSEADNGINYQVHSFDWSPHMLGEEEEPGPAADLVSPITAQKRGDLMSETRTGVITQVLTFDPDESQKNRKARLGELMLEPTGVTPPLSRDGDYAMKIEILSQSYSTEVGGPITLTYGGTWVDPYDPSYNGPWSLTATITRDDNGKFVVKSVEKTPANKSNGNDE
ncbi:hypothetical protein [Brachybacterium sacelli]|uniref:Secreted protein n=1 Tax=Brachybacterium sacelli TaxID=173364 RepID=A0ABS4X5K5_9MICO|nr:hypothetical protein [Brachybacterium sacelli]MBP2383744.1 hypothetical protein [Brachybacterium sacelli]